MSTIKTKDSIYVNNNKTCPCCGSDMKRNSNDNPHDLYTEHYTCVNQECAASITVLN